MARPSTAVKVAAFHTGVFDTIDFHTAWYSCLRQSLLPTRCVASGRLPRIDLAQELAEGRNRGPEARTRLLPGTAPKRLRGITRFRGTEFCAADQFSKTSSRVICRDYKEVAQYILKELICRTLI